MQARQVKQNLLSNLKILIKLLENNVPAALKGDDIAIAREVQKIKSRPDLPPDLKVYVNYKQSPKAKVIKDFYDKAESPAADLIGKIDLFKVKRSKDSYEFRWALNIYFTINDIVHELPKDDSIRIAVENFLEPITNYLYDYHCDIFTYLKPPEPAKLKRATQTLIATLEQANSTTVSYI